MYKTRQCSDVSLLEVEMSKKCTPLWREAHLEVKMLKLHVILGPLLEVPNVEKVHAVVARSTFRSKKWQNTPCSDHFWTSRCRPAVEKVHAVVARSTFPSQKCQNTQGFEPLFDDSMAIRCRKSATPLWREAHFTSTTSVKNCGF